MKINGTDFNFDTNNKTQTKPCFCPDCGEVLMGVGGAFFICVKCSKNRSNFGLFSSLVFYNEIKKTGFPKNKYSIGSEILNKDITIIKTKIKVKTAIKQIAEQTHKKEIPYSYDD